MNDTPLWDRVVISVLLLVPLVGNEYQLYKKVKDARAQQNHGSGSVEDNVFREYRERV